MNVYDGPEWKALFVSFAQLPELGVKLSRLQIAQRQKKGTFPRPFISRNNNESWYLRSEIERWVISDPKRTQEE